MDIRLDIHCMFLPKFIEQNMNNAKAGIGPGVILLSNQGLVDWGRKTGRQLSGSSPLQSKNDPPPVFVASAPRCGAMEVAVPKVPKPILAAAALAAAMSFNIPTGIAAGWRHEPWCAVLEYDDVTWDCSYRTFEECYPNVIGGIRGSCSPNPDNPGASVAAPAEAHKQRKHRAQQ
jgi:hypothetical protein